MNRIRNSYFFTIFFVLLSFSLTSCNLPKSFQKAETKPKEELEPLSFTIDNKTFDSNSIKEGCSFLTDIKNKAPDNFGLVNFFHTYLKFKSYIPNYLSYFGCRDLLESEVIHLFALDREPLNNINYDNAKVDDYTIHREIIRNLYKIIDVKKDGNGNYLNASGIRMDSKSKEFKLFEIQDEELIKEILEQDEYIKFYSLLEEQKGVYRDYFIPAKNYNLIKEYLIKLDQRQDKDKKNFSIAFSSFIYIHSSEVVTNKEFNWIEEIIPTLYHSPLHPIQLYIMKDKTIITKMPLLIGYVYSMKLLKSGPLLAKILKETNIIPNNFSIMPIIENSLKSGSKEYCGSYKNWEDVIMMEKILNKKIDPSPAFIERCIINTKNIPLNKIIKKSLYITS